MRGTLTSACCGDGRLERQRRDVNATYLGQLIQKLGESESDDIERISGEFNEAADGLFDGAVVLNQR